MGEGWRWVARGLVGAFAAATAIVIGKKSRPRADRDGHWRAAVIQGLATSTFSTVFVTLGARRVGRDAAVDWMGVTPAYFGRKIVVAEPGAKNIAAGIFVHQSADFFWAVTYYGTLWRWTRRLSARQTLAAGAPWAALTAAAEYYAILPVIGPWVRMQTPYWVALTVHLVSSAGYPLYPWIRERVTGRRQADAEFARRWAAAVAAGTAGMAALWALGRMEKEPRWPSRAVRPDGPDGEFLRRMTAHHELGLELARMAAEQGCSPELAKLGELMTAEHAAELDLMRSWWRSWFGSGMPGITERERKEMPGMPPREAITDAKRRAGADFDRHYVPVMVEHHEGALIMSDEVLARGHDPRVKALALSILHTQRKQIAEMRRIAGEASVAA